MNIAQQSLRRLRVAIQNGEVSFPSQVPRFDCQSRADIQWRLAELYFIHNWSCPELGQRYGVSMERARQLVFNWVQRAIVLGYLQEIPSSAEPFTEPRMAQQAVAAGFKWTLSPDHLAEGSKSVTSSQPMSL